MPLRQYMNIRLFVQLLQEVRTPRHGSTASSGGVGDADYAKKVTVPDTPYTSNMLT